MADDDMPEMSPSRSSARAQRTQARASLIRAAEGKTMWDVMEEYALEAAVELRLGVDSPDPKERLMSARELLSTYVRLPPRPAVPPEKGMTAEEYEARLNAAEQDPAVRKWLEKRGWTAPTPAREKN